MPLQKPGKSEQVVCTPGEFLSALKGKLGIEEFLIDLAASEDNSVGRYFYSEKDDALIQPWKCDGWGFCNPPYGDIEPWVQKGYIEGLNGANVAMLLPASVGSGWWASWVDKKAYTLFTGPRLTFIGHSSPYPKDLTIVLFTPVGFKGYEYWRWK